MRFQRNFGEFNLLPSWSTLLIPLLVVNKLLQALRGHRYGHGYEERCVMYSRSVGSDGNYVGSERFGREIYRLPMPICYKTCLALFRQSGGRGVTEWFYTGMYYGIYGGLRNQDMLYHPCNECRDTEGLVMHRLG